MTPKWFHDGLSGPPASGGRRESYRRLRCRFPRPDSGIRICMYLCIYIYISALYILYVCIYIYIYIYICIHMYVYMCV